jgi:hypothetical protein
MTNEITQYMIDCGSVKPPIFQKWKQEEIKDYQEIRNKKLEQFYIHAIKKIFSKNYELEFQRWSRGDIKEYQNTISKELDPIYVANEIPLSDPESRMNYVTNAFKKMGYTFKKDGINHLAIKEGKAKALVFLESVLLIEKKINLVI